MKVLVTGAVGFLGSELIRRLLLAPEVSQVFLVIRPALDDPSESRLDRLFAYWRRYLPDVPDRYAKIRVLDWDLSANGPLRDLNIVKDVEWIIHCAATTDLRVSLTEARIANLYSTQKLLVAARTMKNLRRFVHVSTAFVAGDQQGEIKETRRAMRFSNHYERSKLESEDCVKASGVPWTILRPSVIVGDSRNGYTPRFKVIYSVWRMWLTGIMPRAPVDKGARVDIVPVDWVADATIALMTDADAEGQVIHLCAGSRAPLSTDVIAVAKDVFGVKHVPVAPVWFAKLVVRWPFRLLTAHGLRQIIEVMRWQIPYLGHRSRTFDTSLADLLLKKHGISCPSFTSYGRSIFEFCLRSSWGKKSCLVTPEISESQSIGSQKESRLVYN